MFKYQPWHFSLSRSLTIPWLKEKQSMQKERKKYIIICWVWSNKFASDRGKDALCTQRAAVWRTNVTQNDAAADDFHSSRGESELVVQRLSRCSPYPARFWLRCPLTMVDFISQLIKRTSLQPVMPSDTGRERRLRLREWNLERFKLTCAHQTLDASGTHCALQAVILCHGLMQGVTQRWIRFQLRHCQCFFFWSIVLNKVQQTQLQPSQLQLLKGQKLPLA